MHDLLAFSLKVSHDPSFAPRQGHVLPCLCLEFYDDAAEEVLGEDLPAFEEETFLVTFEEDMIDLCKFIVIGKRQVEVRGQSDIIGRHFCKFLDLTNPLNDVNPRHQDILLLGYSCYLRLLCVDNNDQAFLISVHLFEGLPALDELKGLRPIQLVPVPHYCLI